VEEVDVSFPFHSFVPDFALVCVDVMCLQFVVARRVVEPDVNLVLSPLDHVSQQTALETLDIVRVDARAHKEVFVDAGKAGAAGGVHFLFDFFSFVGARNAKRHVHLLRLLLS
jgi:hypothetical protein